MSWTHYPIVFRLESPLHVGYRKVGNLMQTRPYVPGKLLWAALTARITRDDHDGSLGSAYEHIGRLVQEHFRFGYLWPSLDGNEPRFPWKHEDFDSLLLGSYAGTALNYDQQAADEGTLHETEFIAPVARDGQPVYLVGDLWVRQQKLPEDLRGWHKAIQRLQLGGERAYGWGRVQSCTNWQAGQRGKGTTIAGYAWEEHGDDVALMLSGGSKITAHAQAAGAGTVSGIVGPVEPLLGWEQTTGGWTLSTPAIAYAPGAEVMMEIAIRVGENGLWEAVQ